MVFYLRRGGPVHGITNRFQGNRKNRLGMAIVAWTLWNETERLHLEQNIEWQNVVTGIHQTALWIMRVLLQITHWHYHHCSPCWQFPLHSKLPGWKWVFQNSDEKHLDNIRSGDSPPSCGHCHWMKKGDKTSPIVSDHPHWQDNQWIDRSSLPRQDQADLVKIPYQSLIGCLLYLTIDTRPDISYAIQQLSQYLDNYSYVHWHAAIQVVWYLKGTWKLKLCLAGNNISLLGFTDSDWANCLDTRRSVGSYTFSLGSGVILWNVRKQKTVAASSCEAEYIAAFEVAWEGIWLHTLLNNNIHTPLQTATTIFCDNNATIMLSGDPLLHARVKHIDIKYHFLCECIQ